MKIKLLFIALGIVVIAGISMWFLKVDKISKIKPIACTEEAKLCPDGSAVGRTGPNCEFAACPAINIVVTPPTPIPTKKIAAGYVSGHVTIGPFCPVERIDQPCTVPPEAYTSRAVVIYQNDGYTEKARVFLDKDGNYKITLSPGKYFAQIQPAGIGPGEKKLFTVISFETAIVDFNIDTGIR